MKSIEDVILVLGYIFLMTGMALSYFGLNETIQNILLVVSIFLFFTGIVIVFLRAIRMVKRDAGMDNSTILSIIAVTTLIVSVPGLGFYLMRIRESFPAEGMFWIVLTLAYFAIIFTIQIILSAVFIFSVELRRSVSIN